MASGSFTKTVGNRKNTSNEYIKVWWESEPDIENNRSKVRVYAKMYRPWYLAVDYDQKIELWIDDKKYTGSRNGWRGQGWTKAYIDESKWVNHNSDGRKSIKIRLRTQVKAWLRSWVGWVDTGEHTCKLDNIDRESSFTLSYSSVSTNSGIPVGDDIVVNLKRSSSKVTHGIALKIGDDFSQTILSRSKDVGKSGTTKHTITLTPSKILPELTGKTTSATIVVNTYVGSKKIGSSSKKFKIGLRNTDKPSLSKSSAVVVEPIPISSNTATDRYIKGFTRVKVTADPTLVAGKSGYIQTYTGYLNGKKLKISKGKNGEPYSFNISADNDKLRTGENILRITATDKRGMTSNEAVRTFYMSSYKSPKIKKCTAVRCLSNGTANDEGTYVKVTIVPTISSCGEFNSSDYNTATVKIAKKAEASSSNYTTIKTWTEVSASAQNLTYISGPYDLDTSYDFKITVTDRLGKSVSKTVDIGTREILMDIAPSAVAVGKIAERKESFEVGWEAYFEKTIHGTVTTYTSDLRKKEIIEDEDIDVLLDIWDELSVVLYKYKHGDGKVQTGLIAQDVMELFKKRDMNWSSYGLVYQDVNTGLYAINYEFVDQLTLLKMKRMQDQMVALTKRVMELENK